MSKLVQEKKQLLERYRYRYQVAPRGRRELSRTIGSVRQLTTRVVSRAMLMLET